MSEQSNWEQWISNAGSSAGAKKGWETKKGASNFMRDAGEFQKRTTGHAINADPAAATDAARKASDAAHSSEIQAHLSHANIDFNAASAAHKFAARAHRDAGLAGHPAKDFHDAMSKHHEERAKAIGKG